MKQSDIEVCNKIIAKFMGGSLEYPDYWRGLSKAGVIASRNLTYHKFWDALIPVYNKILKTIAGSAELRFLLNKDENCLYKAVIGNFFVPFENELYINSVWLKCVDMINWINKNKP
jgi:hypothetical protein